MIYLIFDMCLPSLRAQEDLAVRWLSMFPENAYKILRSHRFPAGGRLVSVSSDISTPTCKDKYQWKKGLMFLMAVDSTNLRFVILRESFHSTFAGDLTELQLAIPNLRYLP